MQIREEISAAHGYIGINSVQMIHQAAQQVVYTTNLIPGYLNMQ